MDGLELIEGGIRFGVQFTIISFLRLFLAKSPVSIKPNLRLLELSRVKTFTAEQHRSVIRLKKVIKKGLEPLRRFPAESTFVEVYDFDILF
jgi:hypothetical protein